mmetsp:Transcript_12414/g.37601  ORF Transcript_12414/g.37601 Transcript_12414/m.37601 type:complete len:928 (-) Transcript_12414:124-2907(-)
MNRSANGDESGSESETPPLPARKDSTAPPPLPAQDWADSPSLSRISSSSAAAPFTPSKLSGTAHSAPPVEAEQDTADSLPPTRNHENDDAHVRTPVLDSVEGSMLEAEASESVERGAHGPTSTTPTTPGREATADSSPGSKSNSGRGLNSGSPSSPSSSSSSSKHRKKKASSALTIADVLSGRVNYARSSSSSSSASSSSSSTASGSKQHHRKRNKAYRLVQTMRPLKSRSSDSASSASSKSRSDIRASSDSVSGASTSSAVITASKSSPRVFPQTSASDEWVDQERISHSLSPRRDETRDKAKEKDRVKEKDRAKEKDQRDLRAIDALDGEEELLDRDREHLVKAREHRRQTHKRSNSWDIEVQAWRSGSDSIVGGSSGAHVGEASLLGSGERDLIVPLDPAMLAALAEQVRNESSGGSRTSSASPLRGKRKGGSHTSSPTKTQQQRHAHTQRTRAGSDEVHSSRAPAFLKDARPEGEDDDDDDEKYRHQASDVGGGGGGGGGGDERHPQHRKQEERLLEITRVRSGSRVTEFNPLFANRKVNSMLRHQREDSVSPSSSSDSNAHAASSSSSAERNVGRNSSSSSYRPPPWKRSSSHTSVLGDSGGDSSPVSSLDLAGMDANATASASAESSTTSKSAKPQSARGARAVLSTASKRDIVENWSEDLREIAKRDALLLPLHMDLPRLARRFSILVNHEEVYKSPAHSVDIKTVLLHLLYRLSSKLDGQGSAKHVKSLYTTHVMSAPTMHTTDDPADKEAGGSAEDTDVSQQLKAMFTELDLNKSCMGRLLKVCNQKVIFPPYGLLKLSKLYREFPFKDCSGIGSWLIQIDVEQDSSTGSIERVFVTHDRKQQSTEMANGELVEEVSEHDAEYTFRWRLRIEFDAAIMNILSIELTIGEVVYHPNLPRAHKTAIKKAFHSLPCKVSDK